MARSIRAASERAIHHRIAANVRQFSSDLAIAIRAFPAALSSLPDDSDLARSLTADLSSALLECKPEAGVPYLAELDSEYAPRTEQFAAVGFRAALLFSGLGALALGAWSTRGDEQALDRALRWFSQAVEVSDPDSDEHAGIVANGASPLGFLERNGGDYAHLDAAFALLDEAFATVTPGHRHYRLNRGGDRAANNALHTIVPVRMKYDQRSRDYVARRTLEGMTKKDIMRCLKRFVAREIYRHLPIMTQITPPLPQTA